MRRVATALMLFFVAARPSFADDPLARARFLYNQKQFEAAVTAAEQARLTPSHADAADLVAARAYLERFRTRSASEDLTNARARPRRFDPARVPARTRTGSVLGRGQGP